MGLLGMLGLKPKKSLEESDQGNWLGNTQYKASNAHRACAYGDIDRLLEEETITPEQAEEMKNEWDRRHGY